MKLFKIEKVSFDQAPICPVCKLRIENCNCDNEKTKHDDETYLNSIFFCVEDLCNINQHSQSTYFN